MHISLDSALGRQRRLNSVGESVFQIAPNAAAGYSLRSLTGGDPAVVRVRRESDNAERDFNSSGVSSGELVNWVNQQITPPLDLRELTATGRDGPIIDAAAAYSLRNLSDSYTGNVIEVRRSSDDATRSFTAAEAADGTLTDWVNVGKNYVGYARFQDSTTANVSLTSSFTLEATNNWSIKFGYIGGSTPAGLFGLSGNGNTGFWFGTLSTVGITDDSGFFSAISFGSGLALKIGQHHEIEFFNTPADGVRVKVDGVTMSGLPKIYGDITIDRVGLSRGRDGERVIENVRIDLNGDGTLDYSYAGDGNQASNWTDRVGSNNGTPTAQVLTYNNEFTSGFVSQWYDQSTTAGTPNANHAVQATLASQPKIVSAGSLVTGGIDFDGGSKSLLAAAGGSTTEASVFSVITRGTSTSSGARPCGYSEESSTVGTLAFTMDNSIRFDGDSATNNTLTIPASDDFVSTTIKVSNTEANHFLNGGSNILNSALTLTDTDLTYSIGRVGAGTTFDGTIKEVIFYNSDQTDNRTALEANIGEVYSIAGIPAYDDTVNGFVETWYDQSGNDNDATQLTASNQPKIVDGGSLVSGGIDFDGVNDSLSTSDLSLFTLNNVSSFVTSTVRTGGGAVASVTEIGQSSNRFGNPYKYSNTYGFRYGTEAAAVQPESVDSVEALTSLIAGSSGAEGYKNGTSIKTYGTADTTAIVNEPIIIGKSFAGTPSCLVQEAIFYNSDQSANRAAIEANIILQYDI